MWHSWTIEILVKTKGLGSRSHYLNVLPGYLGIAHVLYLLTVIFVKHQCDQIGRFLHFGQQFKAGGNNYFTQIAHIVRQFS